MKEDNFPFIFLCLLFIIILGCQDGNSSSEWSGISPDEVRPTAQQIEYQQKEKVAFVHFGINTFTNREWGTGKEDPELFNPTDFDAEQWAKTLSETGFKTLILTAKHHDGFCLWPSEYTDHNIANSPYKNGEGDIVKEVSKACEKYGLDFGVYLSPWDMHEESYGTSEYNEFYMNQLRELLSNYGTISEIWFDGAKGEGAKDMNYDFKAWWSMVRELQPETLIFSDEGPDIRWIGNEHGFAGRTNWSTIDRDSVEIGQAGQTGYLNSGEQRGSDWVVGECDVSIRPGWFYHPAEDDEVKTVAELTEIYMKSVGRNCTLLLNIPPDTTGQFHQTDINRLYAFSDTLNTLFDNNLALQATVKSSSADERYSADRVIDENWRNFWIPSEKDDQPSLTLNFNTPVTFDLLSLQEFIPIGQRISKFSVSVRNNGNWQKVANETTIGYKRILQLDKTTGSAVRIDLETFSARPALAEIGLYKSD